MDRLGADVVDQGPGHPDSLERASPGRLRGAPWRWGALGVGVVLGLAGLIVAALLWHEPAFYGRENRLPPAQQRAASEAFLERAAALTSVGLHPGAWQTSFSEDELNGWLGWDFSRNLAELLPPEFSEPRIDLAPGRARLGCRYGRGWSSTIWSVELAAELREPNVLAIRLCRARAGAVPVPLGGLLAAITSAAESGTWRLRWEQCQGDPVAVFTIPSRRDARHELWIAGLVLAEDRLTLAGQSVLSDPPEPAESPAEPEGLGQSSHQAEGSPESAERRKAASPRSR